MPTLTPKPVVILLATFNGEKFIAEQLDSLLNQSEKNWKLLIRDDVSTDATCEIIQTYQQRDDRIVLIDDKQGASGSAQGNFNHLIGAGLHTEADFFFFCDQDDIWHPDKIKLQTQILEGMDNSVPALVHHDLEVVDANLKQIHKSFFHLQRLNSLAVNFNTLLCRNEITGCTIACNRKLLEYSYPVSPQSIMHDWWLALICAATGNIEIIRSALIQYRQHGQNSVGAKVIHRLNPFNNWNKAWQSGNQRLLSSIEQAQALQAHIKMKALEESLPIESSKGLQFYIGILEIPRIQRSSGAKKLGLIKTYWLLNILYQLRLFAM